MITRVNPDYEGKFEAQVIEALGVLRDDDDDPPPAFNPGDWVTCIYAKRAGTERNAPILFVVCEWRGQFPRILGSPKFIDHRQGIYGDSVSAIRVTWQSFESVEDLLQSEWEATLDEHWIASLITDLGKFYRKEIKFEPKTLTP